MNSEKAYYERLEIQNKILEDKNIKAVEVAQDRFNRIQKAIEYLEYQLTQLDFYEDTKARVLCSMLIVILKGEE